MFVKLSQQLYPKARAWRLMMGSVFRSLHVALALSEQEYYNNILSLQDSTLPDNNNFNEQDAGRWEKALALGNNSDLSLEIRKQNIIRKINFPGNIKSRQNYLFLERELRLAGFDVYVYENKNGNIPYIITGAICGLATCGTIKVGELPQNYDLIANKINFESDFIVSGTTGLKFGIIIGGATIFSRANIPIERKKEYINLILKIKPAQSIAFSMVDFV